ncbi:helix-turn-helix transcriptional regulator [Mycolicibacterium holsaticum]|uniref:helix-turn-helix transcriptional regulator n=1 Tax=Mycolicibacterium holsaticum TaxID=152142 RepID=UPI001C7D9E4C|nr:helix-turn-helix transcriptional regulator [Mycolicibacterium holsaticum]MDA4105806.1 LuxR family transcriptional regulator [Mycolicibacterium holsaticum DSM 44478 = JCM 12374]QZA13834.1 helix-turn-helix transcriptional regulator [Mycolicibacterium holsaticum DSM 44478 = JCM 12374]UNC08707.1 helix-turn-helix domain-containing protein [Mycolicibacterium holsaticum DSM 44478 = JCM 12374]
MISGNPLAGRDGELDVIRRALGGGGGTSGVVIVGSAGVGKTRLAREVLTRAERAGERTNWIVGTESARALPLGAFTALISDPMGEPMPNVRRVINSFVDQQHRGRVLIGVDDAHLLDGLSAHVVHQLAQSRGARLVVTVRSGADQPDAVTALWKDGLLARLDLEPLSAEATRVMIEDVLGGAVDARSARRFWKLTDGNALFLQQLVKDQVAAGRMRSSAGVWMWDGDVAVSQSITDMVGRQLCELDPQVALVVDTLSQCEPLAVDALCDLVGRADLETAEQLHLITVERAAGTLMARLAHPLFGELRRATAGEMYLSKIRGRLAERLAKDPDADMRATVRRALLAMDSDLPPDPQLCLQSARYAMTLLDLDLADRFAAAAVAAGAPEAPAVRAMNLLLLGRGGPAEEALRELSDDGAQGAHQWATLRATNLVWMLGRCHDAAVILEELARGPESPAEQTARIAIEACVDAVWARCRQAEEKARAALDSDMSSDFHAMMAAVARTMALGALGRAEELTTVAEAALERAMTSFQASHMRFWFASVYARACRLTGRIEECEAMVQRIAESATEVPGLAYANLASLLGHSELMRGNAKAAVKLLHEALAGVERHGITTGLRPATYFALAEGHAKLGEADAANTAMALAQNCVPSDYLFMQTTLSIATGWALAANGCLAEAMATVGSAARQAREREQPTHELACLQAAAQWGDTSWAARSGELADELALALASAVARHTESLAADDGEGLLAASNEYLGIGDRATAADVAAQAAVAFTRGQQRKRGLYAAAVATELSDACGGLCTPALRAPAGQPLTGRQREVVELVVAGLSNREIAKRLVMSVRSVEGHVYRACQRVGASTREELAAIARKGPSAGRRGAG